MADFLGMLLQAKVDPDAIENIKTQIEGIAKHLDPIKIDIKTNKNTIETVKEVDKKLNNIKETQKEIQSISAKKLPLVNVKELKESGVEFTRIGNSLKNTMHEIRNKYQELGEATIQVGNIDPITKSITNFTIKVKESDGIVSKYKYTLKELEELSGKISKGFVLDEIKFNDKTAEIEAKKLKQAHEIRVRLNEEETKARQKMERETAKAKEEMDNIFLESEKRKRQEIEKTTQAQAKASNKVLEDNYKIQQKEELRIKRLGENIGSIKGIDFKDDSAIRKYILSLQEAGAEVTRFQRSVDRYGNSQIKMKVTTEQSKDMLKEQKFVLDENTQSIYKQDEVLKPTINRMLGWSEAIKVAIARSIQWKIAMDLLYGNIKKMREGINFIKDLEHETQQIQMVTKKSTEEVNKLTKSYSQLANELRTNTLDITKSATTFFRQGLNTEEVEDRIVNVTKLSKVLGTSMESTAEKVTAGVNSMEIETERLGDVVTKVGAIAGTSGEEILTIIQRAGATAKQAGISVEELAAIGATISEKTRLSSETIGASLNTILAKFQQVNKMTGEFNEDYGKVIQAVESVGISTIDKQTGELRNTMDILRDLGKAWDTLTKKQQQFVTTAMGVRQFNRFATLLQGSTREMEILTEAQNSQNEMTEQYSIYLNKTEAAAERAKNALQEMWSNAIQSEKIKMFYEATTAITQIIDKIGVLNTIVFTFSTILLLASKKYRSFLWLISESAKEMGLLQGTIFSLGTALDILSLKFDTTKLKALGLKVAILSIQTALTLGLSFVISKFIGWIDKQINKYNELKTANQELIQSFKQNIQQNNDNINRLKELSSEYENIKSKIGNQIELNEEERRTIDELIAINPSLLQGYDERGNAIYDTTQNIKDMIEELERANEIEDIKLVQGGQDFFKEAKKDSKDFISELDNINFQISTILNGFKSTPTGKDSRESGLYIPSLSTLKEQYASLSKEEKKLASGTELQNKIQDTENKLKRLQGEAKVYESQLKKSSTEVRNALFAQARLGDSYKTLSSETKSFTADYIRTMNVMDYEDFIDMQIAVDGFVDALKNADFNKAIKDYQDFVEQLKNDDISAKDFDEEVQKIIESLLILGEIPEDVITRFFKDSSEIEETNNSIQDTTQSISDLYEKVSTAVDEYDLFSQALKELNEEGQISKSTLDKLIEINPDIISQINLQKDALIDLMNASKDRRKQIIDDEIATAKQVMESNVSKILSVKDYADALTKLAQIQLQQRFIESGLSFEDTDIDEQMRRNVEKARQAMAIIERTNKQIQALEGMRSLFDEVDNKYNKSPKSKKEEYKAIADRYARINLELDKNNILLQKNKILQDLAGDDLEKKLKLMQEEIELNKQRQKSLNNLNNERRKEVIELEQSLTKYGFRFTGEGDSRMITNLDNIKGKTKEAEEQFNRYMQLQKDLIPQASQDWWNLQNTIEQVKLDKLITEFEIADKKIEKLNNTLSELEYQFKLLDEKDTSGKADNIAKQIAVLEYQVKLAKEELEAMGEVGDDALQIVKDRQEELNKLIQDGTLAINGMKTSLKDLRETARQEWIREKNALAQAQQDRLRALDQIQEKIVAIIRKRGEEEKKALDEAHKAEMDSLEKRHKDRKQKYKDDVDEFKKMIQAKIDALEPQWEEEDYLEDLNKEREEANRLQKEIDILSLDDSLTARNKVIELRKQLAKQNEKIAKMQRKRERDLLKKSLQDQLEGYEKDAKDKEDIADNLYENEKKRLEEEYRINKEFLERKYSDEQVYAEAKESIMRGTVEVAEGVFMDIYDAFVDFENKFGRGMGILGDIIKDDFIRELEKAQDAIRQLDYIASNRLPTYDSDYDASDDEIGWKDPEEYLYGKLSSMSKRDYESYVRYKCWWEDAKKQNNKKAMKALNKAAQALRDKYGIMEDLYSYDGLKDLSYEQMKRRGYRHGGKITETGTVIAPFHGTKTTPEWIFNDAQLKNIIQDTVQSTFKLSTPKTPNVATRNMTNSPYVFNLNVAGNLDKDVLPDVKKMIDTSIKKAQEKQNRNLNKKGVFRPAY